MLHIQIDPASGVSAYRQVMDQIKLYVASGVLATGEQLPSIRELARSLSVNPSTVVKAYTELQHERVVVIQQGRGAFVAVGDSGLTQRARRDLLKPAIRRLVVEAQQLGLVDELGELIDEEVAAMEQKRRSHGNSN